MGLRARFNSLTTFHKFLVAILAFIVVTFCCCFSLFAMVVLTTESSQDTVPAVVDSVEAPLSAEKPSVVLQPSTAPGSSMATASEITTAEPSPIATITPSVAPEPSSSAEPSTPSATTPPKPPTREPSPTVLVNQELSTEITARVARIYLEPVSVTVTGNQALFELREPDAISFGTALTRISLLDYAQFNAFAAIYTIFYDFSQIDIVTARILVAENPVYEVTATRDQAYTFPADLIDLRDNPDALSLNSTATMARMYRYFEERFIDPGIAAAVNNPTSEDIMAELESWVSGVSVTRVIVDANEVAIDLDMSEYINSVSAPDERSSERTQALIEDNAKMNLVYGTGALMDRFNSLEAIEIAVVLDGERITAYQCTRAMFNAIGSEPFIMAFTLDDFNRVLNQLIAVD